MHIKGGLNGLKGNPLDPSDEGIFISKISSQGAIRRDGRLKVQIIMTLLFMQLLISSLFLINLFLGGNEAAESKWHFIIRSNSSGSSQCFEILRGRTRYCGN